MSRPRPTHTLAHLSDTHITGDGAPVGGVVDARARLRQALEVLTSWNVGCDAWVFSGDLSDDGSEASYVWLRQTVETAAASVGVPVIWANGNHDERGAFRRVLLDAEGAEPVLAEHVLRGLRLLVVDSTVPGKAHGRVAPASLAWLRERLSRPAESGSVVVIHHPPLPPLQDAAWGWVLSHADELAEVLRGTDARAILGGHFHQAAFGVFAGVGTSVAPSLVYNQDLTVGRDLRGQASNPGFSLVEVYPDVVTHTVVPLTGGRTVYPPVAAAPLPRRA